MSRQLESHHFFRDQDTVQHTDGRQGVVTEGHSLFATVEWEGGVREEVEQFDPAVTVLQRAGGA